MRTLAIVCGLQCFLALASPAADPAEITALYRRGLAGDKAAVEQCIEKLEAALRLEPRNQLARVYLGSAYTLRSRDLGFGPTKLRVLRQGLAVMDQAISAAPDQPKVRLARALTTSALPGIFGRTRQSEEDFALLVKQAGRARGSFEAGDLQIIYYHAGVAAKRHGDHTQADSLWREARKFPSDPELSRKIEAEMAAPK